MVYKDVRKFMFLQTCVKVAIDRDNLWLEDKPMERLGELTFELNCGFRTAWRTLKRRTGNLTGEHILFWTSESGKIDTGKAGISGYFLVSCRSN